MSVEPTRPQPVLSVGPYIDEWLDDEGMSQSRLALLMGTSEKHLSQVMNGKSPVSTTFAQQLMRVTSIPVDFWLRIDAHYRAAMAEERFTEEEVGLVKNLFGSNALKPLRRLGHISETWRKPEQLISELLRFTCTGSVKALVARCDALPMAAYRQSSAHIVEAGSVLAWFRTGELAAANQDVPPFQAAALEDQIDTLRTATQGEPHDFAEVTRTSFAQAGVRFVISPDIPGARVSGATRIWRGQPLVQVTDRYKREDSYWFTVFHEIAHLLNDDLEEPHVAVDKSTDPDEVAANAWASHTLLPEDFYPRLRRIRSFEEVNVLAREAGVSSGIVVGQMHHLGIKRRDWGRRLIRPFSGA